MEFVKSRFIKSISLILLFAIFGINGVFAQDQDDAKPLISDGVPKDFYNNLLERQDNRMITIRFSPPIMEPMPSILDSLNGKYEEYQLPQQEGLFISFPEQTFTISKDLEENLINNIRDLDNNFTHNILKDAYVVVFGDFDGESQFFEQYPYDTDFPEWMEYSYTCSSSFWNNLERRYYYNDQLNYFLVNQQLANAPCSDNNHEDDYYIFSLFHPTSRVQDQSEIDTFIIPLKGVMRSRASLLEAISQAQNSLDDADSGEYMTVPLQIRDLIDSYLSN